MNFTERELVAMTFLGIMMAVANGEMVFSEKNEISRELMKHGISTEAHIDSFMAKCRNMDYHEVLGIMLNMTSEKKTYVKNYLERIMRADGSVDNDEREFMQLVSGLIDNDEVISIFNNIWQ